MRDGGRVAIGYSRFLLLAGFAALTGCGLPGQSPEQTAINTERARQQNLESALPASGAVGIGTGPAQDGGGSVFDLFSPGAEPDRQIGVNRYLWAASLDVVSFLPLEGADPFSGVISTDWGRIGGDPTPFRVTVLVSEAALDARSLKVAAFRQQGGRAVPVSAQDNRRLEDAILTRARQLRIASSRR